MRTLHSRVAIHGDLVNHRTVFMATWSITAPYSWRPGQSPHLMRFTLRNPNSRLRANKLSAEAGTFLRTAC
jgi:hypothetical protein